SPILWSSLPARYTAAMIEVFRDVAGPCLAPSGSVVAVGAFDGLHLGHQGLLAEVRRRASVLGCLNAAISFEPLPRAYFSRRPLPRLGSVRDKLEGMDAAGRSEEHTSELQSRFDLVCRLLLENKKVKCR